MERVKKIRKRISIVDILVPYFASQLETPIGIVGHAVGLKLLLFIGQ